MGCAIARELSHFDLRVTLLEAGPDVGAGTSKANTALLHTGFDAKPGTLEARLVPRGFELLSEYAGRVGIPVERTGALLVAWNEEQLAEFPGIVERAHANGYRAIAEVGVEELYRREPQLGPGARGALEVPDEALVCPFTTPLAYATEAVLAGCDLRRSTPVTAVERLDTGGFRLRHAGRCPAHPLPGERGRVALRRARPHARSRALHRDAATGRVDRLRQARASARGAHRPRGADQDHEGGPDSAHRVRQRDARPDRGRRGAQGRHGVHGRGHRVSAGRGRADHAEAAGTRGDRCVRRPARGHRARGLPAQRACAGGLRLRRGHPLHRSVRLDGDRRARARRARRGWAAARAQIRRRHPSSSCRTSASAPIGPTSAAT